jgi:alcohol dehydrogenase
VDTTAAVMLMIAPLSAPFINCTTLKIPGLSYPGGFADAVIVPVSALVRIPEGFSAAEVAPMGCAGVTVFNALRRSAALPGRDLVAILGIGGLGHLAVQFAAKMGFETVAIARGSDREKLANHLGAHHYIDSARSDAADELQNRGGAKVILATATNSKATTDMIGGLTHRGEVIVIGTDPEPFEISSYDILGGEHKLYGHTSGTSREVEETLNFASINNVRPIIEEIPLEDAPIAYEKMLSGDARFRMVLTTGQ